MTQTKIAARALQTMMGLVATLFMLADISVAQNRFFLGKGYTPISGEDKTSSSNTSTSTSTSTFSNTTYTSTSTSTSNGDTTIDVTAANVSLVLGVHMPFPEQDIEADFSLHRIGMATDNTVTYKSNSPFTYSFTDSSDSSNNTTTNSTSSSTDKFEVTESGATNGLGANFRSTRAEGIHGQGGFEYHTGSTDTVAKNTSYVSTRNGETTTGTTVNGLISPNDKWSTDQTRLVLSLGPVFVPAGSSLQHGLLFTRILEDLETNDPPEGTSTVTGKIQTKLVTNLISYTFRTLGEGNAYFGQVGYGTSEAEFESAYTGYTNTSNNYTDEFDGEGSLLLLTGGVLINDAHELSLEVQNSALTRSEPQTKGEAPFESDAYENELTALAIQLGYRYLF